MSQWRILFGHIWIGAQALNLLAKIRVSKIVQIGLAQVPRQRNLMLRVSLTPRSSILLVLAFIICSSPFAGMVFMPGAAQAASMIDTDDPEMYLDDGSEFSEVDIAPGGNVAGEVSPAFPNQAPDQVVDSIASKANDWHEPSPRSEERYVVAIRQWLDSLNPLQRDRARKILREAHPIMHDLRMAIRDKKMQLATLSFDRYTAPETLPKLGQELQDLRNALRGKLELVADRLEREVGVSMGPLGGDGFWLSPPDSQVEARPLRRKPGLAPLPGAQDNSLMELYTDVMLS